MSDTQLDLLQSLRLKYPTPDVSSIEPFRYTLDGGGRHIVQRLIDQTEAKVMIEIGTYLGGSCFDWLEHDPNLIVIAVDPWKEGYDVAADMRRYRDTPIGPQVWKYIDDVDKAIESTQKHGFYKQAIANLSQFGDRIIPMRGPAADILPEIKNIGVSPSIVYIDSIKTRATIDEAYDNFPLAQICGDDWTWRNAEGNLQMQEAVEAFAAEQGKKVAISGATWIVH